MQKIRDLWERIWVMGIVLSIMICLLAVAVMAAIYGEDDVMIPTETFSREAD